MENLNIDMTNYETNLTTKFKNRKIYKPADPKAVVTNIPGTINEVFVKSGQKVKKGDSLLILEAMKMKNHIVAPMDGVIRCLNVSLNDMVPKGTILLRFE
jgi:biotin carboxyl carrier protein